MFWKQRRIYAAVSVASRWALGLGKGRYMLRMWQGRRGGRIFSTATLQGPIEAYTTYTNYRGPGFREPGGPLICDEKKMKREKGEKKEKKKKEEKKKKKKKEKNE